MEYRSNARLLALCVVLAGSVAGRCSATDPAVIAALAKSGVFRHASVEKAWQTASASKRPLIVVFVCDGCPHCDQMLAETYAQSSVQRLLARYAETALAHDDSYHALISKLGIRAFPTTLIVSGEGKIVDAIEGYIDAPAFAQRVGPWIAPKPASWDPATAATIGKVSIPGP